MRRMSAEQEAAMLTRAAAAAERAYDHELERMRWDDEMAETLDY